MGATFSSTNIEPQVSEAVVIGAGPAGLCSALALARSGIATTIVDPGQVLARGAGDQRTAALFAGSIDFLRNLGVWGELEKVAAPIAGIRIVDGLGGLLKSPEVTFTGKELGLDQLGYNVPHQPLVAALTRAAGEVGPLLRIARGAAVSSAEAGASGVTLALSDGAELFCRLAVAADGRRSVTRVASGIGVRTWTYPQSAIACSFEHRRGHGGWSTELHRPSGPCTTVPLPGNASSLVWVERPDEAERLAKLDESAFRAALEGVLQGLLGSIGRIGPRGSFPLAGLQADELARNRIALVGEAAHVLPPIGAQGLNLGLRDAATLADCVADAAGGDIGAPAVLSAYTSARAADVASRIFGIDIFNRSLLSRSAPVQLARGVGLHALRALGPVRRALMREGLDPHGARPGWMSPGGRPGRGAGSSRRQ